MLLPISFLLCTGFVQFTYTAKIGSNSGFRLSSVPPRNIFLENVHPIPEIPSDHPSVNIVNGQEAKRGQFCYQVFVIFTNGKQYWYCGGSLITPNVIMTAAHCVLGAWEATVVLGALDLAQYYEPGRVIIKVTNSSMLPHERYDDKLIHNDIAIMKLNATVKLSAYICTVPIPSCSTNSTADPDNNNNYTISGWGKTSDRSTTTKMMYAPVRGEPQKSCTSFYKSVANYPVIASQVCTSGADGKGTCNGDSGGPLVQSDESGKIFQRGIVSLGLRSCELKTPDVFTDLYYFPEWYCPLLK